jgi:hypothetical protein
LLNRRLLNWRRGRLGRTRLSRLLGCRLSRGASLSGTCISIATLLLLQSRFDDAGATIELFLTQTAGITTAGRRGLRPRRLRRTGRTRLTGWLSGVRTGQVGVGGRTMPGWRSGRRCADATLGFHHHRLRTAMAEALLHRTGGHIATDTGFQGQRRAFSALLVVICLIVFGVAHAACLTILLEPLPVQRFIKFNCLPFALPPCE